MLERGWVPGSPWSPRNRVKESRGAAGPLRGAVPTEEHAELRQALRDWRFRKSKELGVPPYTLFWDRTLDELCVRCPATPEDLVTIWGIGEQKHRTFGAELLALIAASIK